MHKRRFSVAMTNELESQLQRFLVREDGEEELLFALWTPSDGEKRLTALVHTPLYPNGADRQRHGNVSFNPQFFERVCNEAMKTGCGIAFLHSHPGPGWQGMSQDDIDAETRIAGTAEALTDFPLLGMTVGNDGTWSARMWHHVGKKTSSRTWCESVRSVGQGLRVSFADHMIPKPKFRELFRRTLTVWGELNHANLARLRVGIVGLGSVGSIVAETLARMGVERFVLIDFDEIQPHNLDRLLGATLKDIGKLKIAVAARQIKRSSTASDQFIAEVPYSVAEKKGYKAALDCDVIFCCVDRPRARKILNHFAYAHLVPVMDGGIEVRFKNGEFSGVDWQLQTVGPTRPCLECIGAFTSDDASTEEAGKLDDPSYLSGLPDSHRFKRNENVFPFSANLASLEVLQFVALATGIGGIENFGLQRYRYNPGLVEYDVERRCKDSCDVGMFIAKADHYFHLYGRDIAAEKARERQLRRIDA
jgi:molybdopterin/thiamine biosynthesis adenylyltransferase